MKYADVTRADVLRVLRWCNKNFGASDYNVGKPNLRVYKSSGTTFHIKGEYKCDTNTIIIFLGAIESIHELCEAVIHEYHHYLQSCQEYDLIYYEMQESHDNDYIYENHPHEKKCKRATKKHSAKCLAECFESGS